MKTVMFIVLFMALLFDLSIGFSQTEETRSKNSKPSWSESMPERQDVPKFKLNNDSHGDVDLGLGRDALFDRDSILDSDEEEVSEQDEFNNDPEVIKQADTLAKKKRLAEEKRLAEQQILATIAAEEKELAEQQRLAEEAKQQKLADATTEEQILINATTEEVVLPVQESDVGALVEKPDNQDQDIVEESDATNNTTNNAQLEKIVVAETQQPSVYVWKKIKNVLPEYPVRASRNNRSGWVELEVVIGSDGQVVSTNFIKSHKDHKVFIKAALKAVEQWKYDPPSNYGIMENQSKIVRIVFKL